MPSFSAPSGKAVFLSNEIPKLTSHSSDKWKGITTVCKVSEVSAFFRCHFTGDGCVSYWVLITPGHPNLGCLFLLSNKTDISEGSAPSPSVTCLQIVLFLCIPMMRLELHVPSEAPAPAWAIMIVSAHQKALHASSPVIFPTGQRLYIVPYTYFKEKEPR